MLTSARGWAARSETARVIVLMMAGCLGGCAGSEPAGPPWNDGQSVEPTGQHTIEVRFDPIAIERGASAESLTRTFRAEDLPPGPVHALLAIEPGGLDAARAIDRAGVRASITVRSIAPAWRNPTFQSHEGLLEGGWARSLTAWNATPLEYVGVRFFARRHERFEVTIRIDPGSGPALPQGLSASLVIRGGAALPGTVLEDGGRANEAPAAGEETR